MASPRSTRDVTIQLYATSAQRALIDRAASLHGKTSSAFILETATKRAQQVLLDQTDFFLNEADFERFKALLDAPLENSDAVTRLLKG